MLLLLAGYFENNQNKSKVMRVVRLLPSERASIASIYHLLNSLLTVLPVARTHIPTPPSFLLIHAQRLI